MLARRPRRACPLIQIKTWRTHLLDTYGLFDDLGRLAIRTIRALSHGYDSTMSWLRWITVGLIVALSVIGQTGDWFPRGLFRIRIWSIAEFSWNVLRNRRSVCGYRRMRIANAGGTVSGCVTKAAHHLRSRSRSPLSRLGACNDSQTPVATRPWPSAERLRARPDLGLPPPSGCTLPQAASTHRPMISWHTTPRPH